MASRVIVDQLCDVCLDDERRETLDATTHTLQLDGEIVELDLCSSHLDSAHVTIGALIALGRPVAKRRRRPRLSLVGSPSERTKPAKQPCPECGQMFSPMGINQHRRARHEVAV